MEVVQLDDNIGLFVGPDVDDWKPVLAQGIHAIIDMDSGLDIGVPEIPNGLVYLYFPFDDVLKLPDLDKLQAIAKFGASLLLSGEKVLSHCGMGHNRCALMAGLILKELGMSGEAAVALIRQKRPGALYNKVFVSYLIEGKIDQALLEESGMVAEER